MQKFNGSFLHGFKAFDFDRVSLYGSQDYLLGIDTVANYLILAVKDYLPLLIEFGQTGGVLQI